jgi:nucleosome binding factor SPN SPT16 subunit
LLNEATPRTDEDDFDDDASDDEDFSGEEDEDEGLDWDELENKAKRGETGMFLVEMRPDS